MIPPRWAYRLFWITHKAVDRLTGGRLATRPARRDRLGVLFLLTTGRRSGEPRKNGLNYVEDGANPVVVGSNAGSDQDPSWWKNLQARPEAEVEIGGRRRAVRGRLATAAERADAWGRFVAVSAQYDEYRRATEREIPVVILEPR